MLFLLLLLLSIFFHVEQHFLIKNSKWLCPIYIMDFKSNNARWTKRLVLKALSKIYERQAKSFQPNDGHHLQMGEQRLFQSLVWASILL